MAGTLLMTWDNHVRARVPGIPGRELRPGPYIEGKADRTLVLYGQSVRYFCAWLTAQGQPTDLTSLTRDKADWLDRS
jgi:hypothetical protein